MVNGESLYTAYFEFFSFTAEIFPTDFYRFKEAKVGSVLFVIG